MVSNCEKWMRIFDIPDTSHHKRGFTIYKVISMLYPEKCPDAITKITVWKRYSEFKRLHRELKAKHRMLHLKSRFPALPHDPFFKRFNEDVIKERRECILIFLHYVAQQPRLFTSLEFVKFFETSHTPSEMINGSINSIRAELQLPSEPEYHSVCASNSDDEYALSDTDSISTLSSLSPSVQAFDLLSDPFNRSTSALNSLSKKTSPESSLTLSQTSENPSIDFANECVINDIVQTNDSLKLSQSTSLNSVDFSSQYIVDAARYVTRATEMELEKKYDEAFVAYKTCIDILLKNVRGDVDFNRRGMVRFKVEKYLLRAEKIYNLHLSPEIQNINELTKHKQEINLQRPLADLYKYKVIKVIGSGMLVIHSESQQLFYVKVIYKTWQFSKDYLILPEKVPYMVRLENFYNCENALFLVLQYCCGVKIRDYLQQKMQICGNSEKSRFPCALENISQISDNESECSYSDLILQYTVNKNQSEDVKENEKEETEVTSSESKESPDDDAVFEETQNSLETVHILMKSQKLLSSIESTLKKKNKSTPKKKLSDVVVQNRKDHLIERKLSSVSILSDDFKENIVNMKDVVKWAAQLLLALEKLHILGVICCDIKCKNLLIDQKGDLMLTYMCSLSEEKTHKNKLDASVAPELGSFEKITCSVDWWCYGTILYDLLVGMPLKYVHPEGISKYTNLKVPRFVQPEGKSLLKQLLTYEPKKRLGCGINGTEDIKTHPFFNGISWESMALKCND